MPLNNKLYDEAKRAAELFRDSESFLVSAHLRPDGDACGSLSGLFKVLNALGKKVDLLMPDNIPGSFAYLFPDNINQIRETEFVSDHDVYVVLDCGEEERTGCKVIRDSNKTPLVNIDHHASNTMFGNINLVDTSSAATTQILTLFFDKFGFPLDKDAAESLILGMFTDSRFFQVDNVSADTHKAASILLSTGLDQMPILERLNSSRSFTDLQVLSLALSNLETHEDDKISLSVIKQKDLKALNATVSNIYGSGIFNMPLTIRSVMLAITVFEREDGMTACEFRSRGGINVRDVAVAFGGGGHLAASGCSLEANIDEVASRALELSKQAYRERFGI
ncbi:MAG: bifunctional oligoribonuclease/PAP phosphatase NrnA [Candidatus Riflebacteria bacterium]|nr:bifunctional oligoribonuclease/PAP phosphatase NrnA [Candidatus Riflebacteria bacterium]